MKHLKKRYKQLTIAIVMVLFLVVYVGFSLSPNSLFNYKMVDLIDVSPWLSNYTINQEININLSIKPDEIKNYFFKPIIKSQLIISTPLIDSNVFIEIDNKKILPSLNEKMVNPEPDYYIYYFNLPLKNKIVDIYLFGKIPNVYYKEVSFIQIIQRNYYPFESQDLLIASLENKLVVEK